MFMATPGNYTQVIPAARHPMERIFFANTDSVGPVSLTSASISVAREGVEWAKKVMAGKTAKAPSSQPALA
jgi:hypothetical protein